MFGPICYKNNTALQQIYFMQVACSSELIDVFNMKKLSFKKSSVGLIIVFTDLIIIFVIFLLIAFFKWNQDIIC
jgi:hypothetical protein